MDSPMIAQIELFAFTFTPADWHRCDGQLLPMRENQTMYALIGTQYGGDGVNTFALPNMIGLEPIPTMKYCISVQGFFPQRP